MALTKLYARTCDNCQVVAPYANDAAAALKRAKSERWRRGMFFVRDSRGFRRAERVDLCADCARTAEAADGSVTRVGVMHRDAGEGWRSTSWLGRVHPDDYASLLAGPNDIIVDGRDKQVYP